MADTHVSDDRLTDLVLRLLEKAESDRTLGHLRVCLICETRFQEISRESEILRVRPRPAATPFRVAEGVPPGDTWAEIRHARTRRRAAWSGSAAAAAILLLVAFGIGEWRNGDASEYWLPIETDRMAVRSGTADVIAEPLAEAIEAYRRRDTARVVALLQGRPLEDEYEPLKLVLASALVRERRPAEACALLEALDIGTLPLPARDRANWILLTARLQAGDSSSAETILRDLASRPGEFAERARRQLGSAR